MNKTVTYKEPKSYFTPEMLKAAEAWDKANASKAPAKQPAKTSSKKGKK